MTRLAFHRNTRLVLRGVHELVPMHPTAPPAPWVPHLVAQLAPLACAPLHCLAPLLPLYTRRSPVSAFLPVHYVCHFWFKILTTCSSLLSSHLVPTYGNIFPVGAVGITHNYP